MYDNGFGKHRGCGVFKVFSLSTLNIKSKYSLL